MLLAQFQRLVSSNRMRVALWRLRSRSRGEPVGETDALAFPYLDHSTSNNDVTA